MYLKNIFIIVIVLFLSLSAREAAACEYCTIPHLGRDTAKTIAESKDKKWFIKYLYEQQNWKEIPVEEAHELHEDGYDVHDKTKEDFHHFSAGGDVSEQFTLYADIPYIVRNSLEIEDDTRLGVKEQSKGWGDLTVIGNYHFLKQDNQDLSLAGGIKFPTGLTNEKNSVGERFEPELQPGTGSYDYIVGGVYNTQIDRLHFLANIAYVFKTEGDQDYRFGDLLSTSFFVDYLINSNSEILKTKIGINSNYQYEKKHKDNGDKVNDSGGNTIFLGPTLSMNTTENSSIFASILFPVYQRLGGAHQEVEYTWTAGGKIQF